MEFSLGQLLICCSGCAAVCFVLGCIADAIGSAEMETTVNASSLEDSPALCTALMERSHTGLARDYYDLMQKLEAAERELLSVKDQRNLLDSKVQRLEHELDEQRDQNASLESVIADCFAVLGFDANRQETVLVDLVRDQWEAREEAEEALADLQSSFCNEVCERMPDHHEVCVEARARIASRSKEQKAND